MLLIPPKKSMASLNERKKLHLLEDWDDLDDGLLVKLVVSNIAMFFFTTLLGMPEMTMCFQRRGSKRFKPWTWQTMWAWDSPWYAKTAQWKAMLLTLMSLPNMSMAIVYPVHTRVYTIFVVCVCFECVAYSIWMYLVVSKNQVPNLSMAHEIGWVLHKPESLIGSGYLCSMYIYTYNRPLHAGLFPYFGAVQFWLFNVHFLTILLSQSMWLSQFNPYFRTQAFKSDTLSLYIYIYI